MRRNLTFSSISLRRVRIIISWNARLLITHTLALVAAVDSEAGNYAQILSLDIAVIHSLFYFCCFMVHYMILFELQNYLILNEI